MLPAQLVALLLEATFYYSLARVSSQGRGLRERERGACCPHNAGAAMCSFFQTIRRMVSSRCLSLFKNFLQASTTTKSSFHNPRSQRAFALPFSITHRGGVTLPFSLSLHTFLSYSTRCDSGSLGSYILRQENIAVRSSSTPSGELASHAIHLTDSH